jgi:hypothetical protein
MIRRTLSALSALTICMFAASAGAQETDRETNETGDPGGAPKTESAQKAPADAPAEKADKSVDQMPGSPGQPKGLGEGLKKIGPGKYELTRAELYRMMAASPFLGRQLWVRKVKKEGKLVGYKLKNIKKRSVVFKAGFRNGDVVTHIAGKRLTQPERLLLVIPTQDKVVVKLLRKGKSRTLGYTIVP